MKGQPESVLSFVSLRMRRLSERASGQIRTLSRVMSAASDAESARLRQQLESTGREMLSLSQDICNFSYMEGREQDDGAIALLRNAEAELDKVDLLINKMRL